MHNLDVPMATRTALSSDPFQAALDHFLRGAYAEAGEICSRLLAANEKHLAALCMLAVAEQRQGRLVSALDAAKRGLSLHYDVATLCIFASIARAGGHLNAAEAAYRQALAFAPENGGIMNELALLLAASDRIDEAEAMYRQALPITDKAAEVHNNLGVLLKRSGRLLEADAAYRAALSVAPDYAEAHNNIGVLAKERGDFSEAEIRYRRAIALKDDYADARWNLALILLAQGRYREGWPFYEARYHPKRTEGVSQKPILPFPQWQGEPLDGKSLIVWAEQGYGDYVQFVRYVPRLKQRGAARVTLACAPAIKALMQSVEGADAVLSETKLVEPHDFWVFPLSLPALFDDTLDTIPCQLPYLGASQERLAYWTQRVEALADAAGTVGVAGQRYKVGIVWKGNPAHKNDAHRSLPSLSVLESLWSLARVAFFSLQKGDVEEELALANAARHALTPLGTQLADFAETAAVIASLDLVISVDTAVAHVCGALGKPCWLLLSRVECDWRWMTDRTDSPWYPGIMQLFRQGEGEDWGPPVARLRSALAAWTGGNGE